MQAADARCESCRTSLAVARRTDCNFLCRHFRSDLKFTIRYPESGEFMIQYSPKQGCHQVHMLCLVSDSAIIDSWSSFDYLIVQYSCTMSKILSAVNLFCQQIYLYGLKIKITCNFFLFSDPIRKWVHRNQWFYWLS